MFAVYCKETSSNHSGNSIIFLGVFSTFKLSEKCIQATKVRETERFARDNITFDFYIVNCKLDHAAFIPESDMSHFDASIHCHILDGEQQAPASVDETETNGIGDKFDDVAEFLWSTYFAQKK